MGELLRELFAKYGLYCTMWAHCVLSLSSRYFFSVNLDGRIRCERGEVHGDNE